VRERRDGGRRPRREAGGRGSDQLGGGRRKREHRRGPGRGGRERGRHEAPQRVTDDGERAEVGSVRGGERVPAVGRGADERRARGRELEEVTTAATTSWEVVHPIAAREGEILPSESAAEACGYNGLRCLVGVHYIRRGTDGGRARCVGSGLLHWLMNRKHYMPIGFIFLFF
jgi:hypothetical protein